VIWLSRAHDKETVLSEAMVENIVLPRKVGERIENSIFANVLAFVSENYRRKYGLGSVKFLGEGPLLSRSASQRCGRDGKIDSTHLNTASYIVRDITQ